MHFVQNDGAATAHTGSLVNGSVGSNEVCNLPFDLDEAPF